LKNIIIINFSIRDNILNSNQNFLADTPDSENFQSEKNSLCRPKGSISGFLAEKQRTIFRNPKSSGETLQRQSACNLQKNVLSSLYCIFGNEASNYPQRAVAGFLCFAVESRGAGFPAKD
jgi:hypothetical protein